MIPIVTTGILLIVSIYLLALLIKSREKRIEASILSNPPTFIEVLENKPLVVKIDEKYSFILRHPSSIVSIRYLSRLRQLFATIREIQKNAYSVQVEKAIQGLYISVAMVLYNMSRDEYKGIMRRAEYKKALILRAVMSTEWLTGVVSEINDFWRLIKKRTVSSHGGYNSTDPWRGVYLGFLEKGFTPYEIEKMPLRILLEYYEEKADQNAYLSESRRGNNGNG